ncbi:MAG: response regulator transcription factor [Bacteroidetes bacterium]|nr:response regulator transcription factor [Bacteroidota bacterium]
MDKIRIIIADDHPVFRLGLVSIIKKNENIILCGEAENGEEALVLIHEHKPDVAILDIEMPLMNGLTVCEEIKKKGIATKLIILTFFKELELYEKAISLGVKGYLLKNNAIVEIVTAIESVYYNGEYISPVLKDKLLGTKSRLLNSPIIMEAISKLSISEKNILTLIAEERTTKEIAGELFISEKTVEKHRYNISKKLNLESGKNNLLKFALANKQFF